MADDGPELRVVNEDEPGRGGCLPMVGGLGLMAYGLLIVGMGTVGLIGITWVIYTTRVMAQQAGSVLMGGATVDGWRLQELRAWGVLGEDVTPALYHDHSNAGDGSAGCMVADDHVLVWAEQSLTQRVPLAGATVSGVDEGLVTVTIVNGGDEAVCWFRPDEGGDRFLAMLEVETR